MKKLISAVLAVVLVLSLSVTAFATGGGHGGTICSEAKTFAFTKDYVDAEGDAAATFPAETLQFTVTAAQGNPDNTMITVADQSVDANPDEITVNVPSYTKVGKYNYTVTEVAGNTQGVTYSEVSFDVQVLVTYNAEHTALVATTSFTTEDGDGKLEGVTNIYDLGSLSVKKTVSGNLASRDKEFEVDVTFTAEEGKVVKSAITYVDGADTKTITAEAMADGTETVTITLKADETVTFSNIPAGITYAVAERDYTDGDVNSENGYDAPEYTNESGTIEAGTTAEAAINNNKGTTVDTGIGLDSLPYVVIMAVAVIGLATLIVRRRTGTEA